MENQASYWKDKVVTPELRTCNLGLRWLPSNFKLHRSFDAQHWAAAFLDTLRDHPDIIIDHELMVAWFANALMRGYDEREWRTPEYKARLRRALHPWWSWKRYLATGKQEVSG